jgi:prepilin-type N-terminal cleavage/methylation domain-containing protein
MRRLVSNQRGMTLAEVLVALPIITIGLLALLSAIPLSTYAIQEGSQTSTATFLANQRLEQVRNAQWTAGRAALTTLCPARADGLGLSASSTAAPQNTSGVTFGDESPMAAPYTSYTRQVRITDSVPSTTDCNVATGAITGTYGIRRVTVTVTYTPLSATGTNAVTGPRSVAVSMQVAER